MYLLLRGLTCGRELTREQVRACSASLSGFTVAVRRPARRALLASVALLGLLLAAAGYTHSLL